ncbi:MAG: hypothetical protein IT494_00155 [Gammaproteobacteria bacterium]|nr:hypothetical protein [Gammaproteobacteria bacterium]
MPARFDWVTPLRGALALCLGSVLLSVALFLAGAYYRDRARAEFTAEQQRSRAISARYLAIDEDRRIIQEQLPEFERLAQLGIIGEERRLDWLETLRFAGETIGLPEFSYRIDPQRPHLSALPALAGRQGLRASQMTLDLGLLHEDDLVALFDLLDTHGAGLYHVSHCVLDRGATTIDPSAVQANLKAQCELLWFTVEFSGNTGGSP